MREHLAKILADLITNIIAAVAVKLLRCIRWRRRPAAD